MTPEQGIRELHSDAKNRHLWTLMTIGLLCFCVTMQLLGSPMTLWAIDGTFDQFESEGFSVPSRLVPFNPHLLAVDTIESRISRYFVQFAHSQFRPPRVGR